MSYTEHRIAILQEAIAETARFTKAAHSAVKRLKEDRGASISGSKETAAVKRASMDLSRALTKVRR